MRIVLRILLALIVMYFAVVAGLAIVMRQPPDKFGAVMAKVPGIAFAVLPFETLWMNARAGRLQVGDPAPDFTLKTVDGSSQVALSSLRGQPVVLVFGSYT
jgi:AhpC/TSA family